MIALIWFALAVLASPFKSKRRLEAENAVLRHQLIVLQRKVRGRAQFTNSDRWFFVRMYRWFPSILKVVTIVQPETLVSWALAARRWLSAEPPNFHEVDDALSLIVKEGNRAGEVVGQIRALRRRERYMPLVAFCLSHFLADFIICMCVFDFRQAQLL